jgi:T5SS/PEP-CTERM-associated repeat protein
MSRSKLVSLATWMAFCLASPLSYVSAAFTTIGNVTPTTNPASWTTDTWAHIGDTSYGSLRIDGGSDLNIFRAFIGRNAGSTGAATVSGSGSTWNISGLFSVGYYGSGTLSIIDGGQLKNGDSTAIGEYEGTRGLATVSGAGSKWTSNAPFWVGYFGIGTLKITNGGSVNTGSSASYIRSTSGTASVATVDGVGSTWNSSQLFVGEAGKAVLSIVNGGVVTNQYDGSVGYFPGAAGSATVNGIGSKWSMGTFVLGNRTAGAGMITIAAGGVVAPASVGRVTSGSLLAIDVGNNSLLDVGHGTGEFSNAGKVRIVAGAKPADQATFSPIAAQTWSDASGTYQAVGGKWDSTNHLFTASAVTSGTSGTAVSLNLATVERAIVTYNGSAGTNWAVGASFPTTANTSNISFTATAISGATLAGLKDVAGTGRNVLSGWTFAMSEYTVSSDNPVYYSFRVGAGLSTEDLDLWQYNGTTWASYTPFDLAYDGMYASFTATNLSGYAVTPEPSTFALLGIGTLGLLAYAWRRSRAA